MILLLKQLLTRIRHDSDTPQREYNITWRTTINTHCTTISTHCIGVISLTMLKQSRRHFWYVNWVRRYTRTERRISTQEKRKLNVSDRYINLDKSRWLPKVRSFNYIISCGFNTQSNNIINLTWQKSFLKQFCLFNNLSTMAFKYLNL